MIATTILSRTGIIYCFLLLLLSSWNAAAQIVPLETFIEDMVSRHGFNKLELTQLFAKTKVYNSILKIMNRTTSGKGRPWYRYRSNFITDHRISEGTEFWRQHAAALSRAEATYGVPAEIIIAIIGVETIYGKNTGDLPVLDALTTIAFHYPRRAEFFRSELEEFLLLTREEKLNPRLPTGSYAGAMGLGQFMPSSFRKYAVDFDGDGKRDIWDNFTDAIGSVANYFHGYGWQTGQPVILATQVRPEAINSLLSAEFKPLFSLKQLKQQGLLFQDERLDNQLGMLIDLETELGTAYWVGFENFYVITRYNRSENYAMAVYQLAQEIANIYYAQSH